MKKGKKPMLSKLMLSNIHYLYTISIFIIPLFFTISCASKEGKPITEFRIIQFFPPSGFNLQVTEFTIFVAFSKILDEKTVSENTVRVFKDGQNLKADIKVVDGQTIQVKPLIITQGKYKVSISKEIKSIRGENLKSDFSWEFQVVGEGTIFPPTEPPKFPPLIKKIYPPHLASVKTDTVVYVIFTKPVINVNSSNFLLQDVTGKIITSKIVYIEDNNTALLIPESPLTPSQIYIATVKSGITAADGEILTQDVVWSFLTLPEVGEDKIPPSVILIIPQNGAQGVPINTEIKIFFSEDINTGTIQNIRILDQFGQNIPYSFSYDSSLNLVVLKPSGLVPARTYTVVVQNIKDIAGNTMDSIFTSSFATADSVSGGGNTGDTTRPQIQKIFIDGTEVTLPGPVEGVSVSPTIKVFFSEKISPSTVNSSTFFISDGVNNIPSTITFDLDLTSAELSPNITLNHAALYWVFITGGIEDMAGNQLENPVTFPISTIGVKIVSPTQHQYLRGIINIEVDFKGSPNRLELWIDTVKRQTALPPLNSPFIFQENTVLYGDGQHTIRVNALFGQKTTSYSVNVTFDNTPPAISVQSPNSGAVLSDTAVVRVSIADPPDGKLKFVELYIDGVFHSRLTSPTIPPNIFDFLVNTSSFSDGNHTLSIRAEDIAGNFASTGEIPVKFDNTPPTGSFVTPPQGSIVSGTVQIEANASDAIGVKSVRFFINSTQICDAVSGKCDVSSPPYRMLWNSTSIGFQSSAPLTGVVEDLAGQTFIFSTSITIDNSPPSVSISLPAPASYLRGTTTIRVVHSDALPITSIAIFIDGIEKFSASNPPSPYDALWNTSAETDGTHTIRAKVFDSAGNQNTAEISVVTDNTPPSGNIASPPNGFHTNSNSLTINVSASDNILIDRVEFYINNLFRSTDSSSPYTHVEDISLSPEAVHTITAVIYDMAGNFTTTSPVTFIVDRTQPDVQFSNPMSDGVVEGTVMVSVSAFDSSPIQTIKIFVNSSLLGSCSNASTCSRNWATSGDSKRILKAEATDKAGNTGVTEIVVIVNNLFPSASITSPTKTYLKCPTDTVLGANASDQNGITRVVTRFIDIPTSSELASFTFDFSPATSPVNPFATLTPAQCGTDGSKRVEVIAYDIGGKSKTASRNIIVDNTDPGLSIIFPTNSECVSDNPSGVTKVVVSACDSAFLKSITLYVDSTLIQAINVSSSISCSNPQTYNFSWLSRNFSDGTHQVSVTAVDEAGNFSAGTVDVIVDNFPPTLSITSPANNSAITSPIPVTVTLGDSVCAPPSYPFKKVEYQIAVSGSASFSSSTQSCAATGRIPCTDTSVGAGTSTFTWSATEYCGYFVVKAIGYDYAGNKASESVTLKIHPLGCPIDKSWSPFHQTLGAIRMTPIMADINSDGEAEIIFTTDGGRVYAVSGNITVQNSEAAGNPIRSSPVTAVVTAGPKMVFGTGGNDKKIRALNLNLTTFSSVSTQTAIFSSPSTIIADGVTAVILVGDLAGRVGIYKLSSLLEEVGCLPAGAPLDCGLNSTPISDLNGDGKPDILSSPLPVDTNCDGNYDTVVVTATDGYITAINIQTRTKNWAVYTASPIEASPILTDLGNNCDFEIIVATKSGAIYCVNENGGACPGWSSLYYSAGGQIFSPPAVADIDSCLTVGDTDKEIVFGNSGGVLTILSSTGTLKTTLDLGPLIVSTPALADIDGNGCAEIFVATGDGRIHGLKLIEELGAPVLKYLTGYPKSTGGVISANVSPIVCDIDKDGTLELAIGNDSGSLRVYELGPGSAGPIKWIPSATFCSLDSQGCQRRWDSNNLCGY